MALDGAGGVRKLQGIDAMTVGIGRLQKLDQVLTWIVDTLTVYYKTKQGLERDLGRIIDVSDRGKKDRRYWIPPENQDEFEERVEALLDDDVEPGFAIEPMLALSDFYDDETPEESYRLTAEQARQLLKLGLLKGENDGEKPKPRRKSANTK